MLYTGKAVTETEVDVIVRREGAAEVVAFATVRGPQSSISLKTMSDAFKFDIWLSDLPDRSI